MASKSRYFEKHRDKPNGNNSESRAIDSDHQAVESTSSRPSYRTPQKASITTKTKNPTRNSTCQTILSFDPQAKLTIDKDFFTNLMLNKNLGNENIIELLLNFDKNEIF